MLREKLLAFALQEQIARAGIDEHAATSLALDELLVDQLLITLQNRERIDPILGRDSQPIYRQLRDRVVAMILDGVLNEGDPLPSVRNVAAEHRVNPLTVLKSYQQLVDEQLVEKKRGRGMFINAGARDLLLQGERQKFLAEVWPRVHATIQRLGLTAEELLEAGANRRSTSDAPEEER